MNIFLVRTGQETVNAIRVEVPLAVLRARDIFKSGVDAVGLGVATVGLDLSSIGTSGSDGVVGVDVDDLAGDNGVLFKLMTVLMG